MTQEELDAIRDAKIAEQAAEIARLTSMIGKSQTLKCKVSEKGGISVYGLNAKWPVTLYGEQWKRLADYMPNVIAFASVNSAKLTSKADRVVPETE
mgnify:FL=1